MLDGKTDKRLLVDETVESEWVLVDEKAEWVLVEETAEWVLVDETAE